ncbi:transcriptional regulator [Streptomyces sp. NPDC088745]|uniref:transcriptional regulator n=1 Tax=Streptomyces sp. NPDC088745 TaxID=3365884 RepID=UPI00382482A8
MLKFVLPPRAAQNTEFVARRLKDVMEGDGPKETVTVEWHGRPLHVGVIDMPLRDLYYNPATHRIRAQRDHDPALAARLEAEPWLDESQDYLNRLLVGKPTNPDEPDPEFVALMDSLREVEQQEPGLITHAGILVNGNTRAAALRELKKTSIRVGVLPPSFTWEDINEVELSLQLRPDRRREYSYINRLLAMEEQELMGRSAEDIARSFHIQKKTFYQERWILGVIQDMIGRSRTGEGVQLAFSDFEGHQENLKELHRIYSKAAASNQDLADQIKENRIVAIILDFAKTQTRLIGDQFHSKYLEKSLPQNIRTAPEGSGTIGIPGLSVSVSAPSGSVAQARAVTDQVLQAKALATARAVPAETRQEAQKVVADVSKGVRRALDAAARDDRLKKVQQTAAERLDDARASVDQCVSDLTVAFSASSLDEEAFDAALVRLKDSLAKLARSAHRGVSSRDEGMTWLLKASGYEA